MDYTTRSRLEELALQYHTHPDEGGDYLSLDELNELCGLQHNRIRELEQREAELRGIIDEHLHQRKCHECGRVGWHKADFTPWVLCPRCGSADTRRINAAHDRARDAKEE